MTVELLEKRFGQGGVKLLNSYFATTTLTKNENMINRFLKKKAIDRTHSIIIPINNSNHWYFIRFDPTSRTLTVYDSLRKRPDYYQEHVIFKNALKFGRSLYEAELQLVVCEGYPQQNNGFDCGVFMLMGIRDALRGREWSFRQGDMRFKRIQLACEVYHEELMLGDGS
jgi:Ulp1 family protease